MSEKPKLNLIFLNFLVGGIKINSYRLSFDPKLYFRLNPEKTHEIPEQVFKFGKDKSIIYICSINTIYIEENYIKNGYNLEIDFKYSNNLSIKINDKEIKIT